MKSESAPAAFALAHELAAALQANPLWAVPLAVIAAALFASATSRFI